MNRRLLIGTLGISMLAGGFAVGQTPTAKPDDHASHHPEKAATPKAKAAPPTPTKAVPAKSQPGMNCEMTGHEGKASSMDGKMGHGQMMEGGHMMGQCSGMFGPGAKVEVNKQAKGVTVTVTSDDPKVVARIQNMAEGMKRMHEAKSAK
jgi:hypothetical protein